MRLWLFIYELQIYKQINAPNHESNCDCNFQKYSYSAKAHESRFLLERFVWNVSLV